MRHVKLARSVIRLRYIMIKLYTYQEIFYLNEMKTDKERETKEISRSGQHFSRN